MQFIPADSRVLCELRHLLAIVDGTKLEPLESLCHAIAAITYATMMAVVVGYRANHYLDRCMLPLFFSFFSKFLFVLLARWTDACFQGKKGSNI